MATTLHSSAYLLHLDPFGTSTTTVQVLPAVNPGEPNLSVGGTTGELLTVYPRQTQRTPESEKRRPRAETGPERWARWESMLASGRASSKADLARQEGVSRSAVTQGLKKLRDAS